MASVGKKVANHRNNDDTELWIGATDDGFAPWLAPGGRVDGGAVPPDDARTGPPEDWQEEAPREVSI